MNKDEILVKINQLKVRVKEIVQEIQSLKGQLEEAAIPLEEFKSKKLLLEEELREILQQIAQVKEVTVVKKKIQPEKPAFVKEKPQIDQIPEKSTEEIKDETSQLIEKEIITAQEAKDLMYYFQTEFINSITNAKVYLSIMVDKHFIIGIDFIDYPLKPKFEIPINILELFNGDINKFWKDIPSYSNWDSNNPKKVYELIIEIESVLINVFQADLETIERRSVEQIEEGREIIKDMIDEAQNELDKKHLKKAINIYYDIIAVAQYINDYESIKKYRAKLNELLRKK